MECDDLPAGIRPATAADIDYVAEHLRPEHLREIDLAAPGLGARAVQASARQAVACYAGFHDGEKPLFIVGVGHASLLTGTATAWLMGTREIDQHGIWVAEVSRAMLPVLHQVSGAWRLENRIPGDYTAAIRWLRWLGFTVLETGTMSGGVEHVQVFHDTEMDI